MLKLTATQAIHLEDWKADRTGSIIELDPTFLSMDKDEVLDAAYNGYIVKKNECSVVLSVAQAIEIEHIRSKHVTVASCFEKAMKKYGVLNRLSDEELYFAFGKGYYVEVSRND